MNEDRIREALRAEPTAAEREAEERAWRVVHEAFEQRSPTRPARSRRAIVLSVVGATAIAGLVLSPAGAKVREWIADAVEPGVERARPALTALPAPGRLLVESDQGLWTVERDGGQRLLGEYTQGVWSPGGAFAAATSGNQLVAVVADPSHALAAGQPAGTVRWAVSSAEHVADPAWAPSGFRVAYLAGSSLRVVAGDGSDDRLVARGVSDVAPVWRPLARPFSPVKTGIGTHVLAYVDGAGRVVVRDVDSRDVLARTPEGLNPVQLLWSADQRLIALRRDGLTAVPLGGDPGFELELDGAMRFERAAFLEGGEEVVIAASSPSRGRGERASVTVWRIGEGARPGESLFAGPGHISDTALSPDGERLLLAWGEADQWLFIRLRDGTLHAVSNISRQFDPGGDEPARFPSIAGWCCR